MEIKMFSASTHLVSKYNRGASIRTWGTIGAIKLLKKQAKQVACFFHQSCSELLGSQTGLIHVDFSISNFIHPQMIVTSQLQYKKGIPWQATDQHIYLELATSIS